MPVILEKVRWDKLADEFPEFLVFEDKGVSELDSMNHYGSFMLIRM